MAAAGSAGGVAAIVSVADGSALDAAAKAKAAPAAKKRKLRPIDTEEEPNWRWWGWLLRAVVFEAL